MPSSTLGSLSMHSTAVPSSWPRSTATGSRAGWIDGAAVEIGTSTEKREPRPGAERRSILWSSTRPMRSTIERPRPRPRATLAPSSSRWNSRKITRFFDAECRGRCRSTSIRRLPRLRRQPTSTRPFGVYLIALETRFCSSRRSSRRSERTASEQGMNVSAEALLAGQRRELDLELAQQFVDAEADELRPHRAGVEPGDVEQRAENLLDRFERGIDVARPAAHPRSCPRSGPAAPAAR